MAGIVIYEPGHSVLILILAAAVNLLFIPVPVTISTAAPLFVFDGPTWSPTFELLANGVLAPAFPWLSRRNLVLIIVASAACVLVVAVARGNLHVGWELSTLVLGVPRTFFSFFVGVPAARTDFKSMPRLLPESVVRRRHSGAHDAGANVPRRGLGPGRGFVGGRRRRGRCRRLPDRPLGRAAAAPLAVPARGETERDADGAQTHPA